MTDDSLLRGSADRGVRLLALALLANTRNAGARLTGAADDGARDDALHDFRVAQRRLRSWLRAFTPWFNDSLSRKRRRRLGEIADATGVARDATVHIEWLHGEQRGMGARQRVGGEWLRKRLANRRTHGMAAALSAAADFDAMAPKLERTLGRYWRDVSAEEPPGLGVALAARLLEESASLRAHLAAIADHVDVDEVHRARIAAKRLRYVVEPVAMLTVDGESIIERLKSLQDALGDLHDVHVFSKEVATATEDADAEARPGLARLARRLEARGSRAYAGVAEEWLSGAGAPFFAAVEAVASDLEHRATPPNCRATRSRDP
ncbi:MAG: CHAD domain-containing protein [Gemmatimonadaceae bacterium]